MIDEPRSRGILTKKDREFLSDPETYREENSRQAIHERKNGILERTWNGLLDGSLLVENTGAKERREIFDGWQDFATPASEPGDEDRPDSFGDASESRGKFVEKVGAEEAFSSWLSFLYLGLSESDEFSFENALRTGIERAEESRGRIVDDLDLHLEARERRSLEELKRRLQRRQPLTTEQIQRLRSAGDLTDDELLAYYDERPNPTVGDASV